MRSSRDLSRRPKGRERDTIRTTVRGWRGALLATALLAVAPSTAVGHEGLLHPELVNGASPVGTGGRGAGQFQSVETWVGCGSGDRLNHPTGVAVDPSGRFVYVADSINNRVLKFSSDGVCLANWETEGPGDGEFGGPVGIAVDSHGDVYVGEWLNNRIQKFGATGTFLTKWGTAVPGPGQFSLPDLLAFDPRGGLYVTQLGASKVQRYTVDGKFVSEWGGPGPLDGKFLVSPHGVATDSRGDVYTTDSFRNRIQKFTPTGSLLTAWGSFGTGGGHFRGPHGLAVGPDGSVYVTDLINNRIQKFTPSGRLIAIYGRNGGDGTAGGGRGEFNFPEGIASDGRGSLYVTDSGNNRIQKLQERRLPDAPGPLGSPPVREEAPAPAEAPAGRPRVSLSVRPRSARVGRRTRFRFGVRALAAGRARPLRGARIRFGGRSARTGTAGRATVTRRFRRPGRYRVLVTKRGYRAGRGIVTIVPRRR